MLEYNKKKQHKQKGITGGGIVNTLINKLPFELHLPGYQYCGPGTRLAERLSRGDPGVNSLDKACKEHDIAYSKYKNTQDRNIADRILATKAWSRVKAGDSNLGERANALLVTNIMNAKSKFGMGMLRKKKGKKLGKKLKNIITLSKAMSRARKAIEKQKPDSIKAAIALAQKEIRSTIKHRRKNLKIPRVVSVPKTGGILPFLIPLFAGLSAAGALAGGATNIVKAVNAAKNAKEQLKESERHNQTMEAIAIGKGLFLKPYKKGLGLFLSPPSKNY